MLVTQNLCFVCRRPTHVVQRNQFNLAFKMESGVDSSKQCCPSTSDVIASTASSTTENTELDDNELGMLCSTEMSNEDIIKIKELSIDDTASSEDCTDVHISKMPTEELEHKDSIVELNSNGKIPNRDSGIDSPSCSVAGESFLNGDHAEQKKASVIGHPAEGVRFSTGEQKRDSAQDEDSDIDEGSSEEQETTEVPKLDCVDINKVRPFTYVLL